MGDVLQAECPDVDSESARKYLEMARERPAIICADVPLEILEAATDDDNEPSPFIQDFLEAGHRQWLIQTQGRVRKSEQMVKNTVVVLWVRATRLYNNRSLNRPDPDEAKPFFSDEGLY